VHLGGTAHPGNSYNWTSDPPGFSSHFSNPVDNPKTTTEYVLTETVAATGCTKTDSVKITVVPRPVVRIQTDSINAFTRKFNAVNTNYSSNTYDWLINDTETGTGYSIIHTFKNEGSYFITLRATVPGYCTVQDSVKININAPFRLDIFPNPFTSQANIRYVLPNQAHIKIVVLDMLGREITTLENGDLAAGEYNTSFNIASQNTRQGMYLIVFMMDDQIITKKIVQAGSIFTE
jgi:hypothetical protein